MRKLYKFYPRGFNPQQYWDDKYAQEHIAGKNSGEFEKQGFWPALEQYLTKEKRYLDVGCGIGGWILFLKERGYDVEGIDIAARTIRALTEYDPDLRVKVASMTEIPYADGSLDGALAIGVLEYVEDRVPAALEEMSRVLKDDGLFFMEVPIANSLRRWLYLPLKQMEFWIKKLSGQTPTFSNYLFDRGVLRQQLEGAGFEIVVEQAHELPEAGSHYGLYIDWKILRGKQPYQLNGLGRLVKLVAESLSPWIASTGVFIVARKRKTN